MTEAHSPIGEIVDSHCHLDFDAYGDDRPAVIDRARAAGIVRMICIGSGRDIVSARSAVALAAQEPDIFATVGIHPHDVARMGESDWQELGELARAPRVVGVGETGLDYHYDHSPRDLQQTAFRRFVRMCHDTDQPVVCHIRDAHADAVSILREEGIPARGGVIHCFTGNSQDAAAYLELGLHLSFSGIVTFKTAGEIRAAVALAPLDRILVETDAPYLAPIPYRGKRNEPAFIVQTVNEVARTKQLDGAEVAAATTRNARA
ncbi:MAG TPA: TatD family hydrolase, partial [Polyangia bacterium]